MDKKIISLCLTAAWLLAYPVFSIAFSIDLRGAQFRSGHPVAGEALEDAVASLDDMEALSESAELLVNNPLINFEVVGFVDQYECSGQECSALALRRAVLVYRFLLEAGVDPAKLAALTEYGWSRPLTGTREDFAVNQRVEIHIAQDPAE